MLTIVDVYAACLLRDKLFEFLRGDIPALVDVDLPEQPRERLVI